MVLVLGICMVGAVAPEAAATRSSPPAPAGSAHDGTTRPNVLIIVTDDQRADMMPVMDDTLDIFGNHGVSFTNGYANTPLCCPSRASIFSGRFAHNHGVRVNGMPTGFDHQTTIQRYLRGAGYTTAVVGKFFNNWPNYEDPPNFDRWATTSYKGYTSSIYNVNGEPESVSQYSTDYIGDRSIGFLQEFEAQDAAPWFLHVAPVAPHLPATAEPAYADAPVPAWDWLPSAFEKDLSDKPPYVQSTGAKPLPDRYVADDVQRALLSVDDMVRQIFQSLEEQGEADDTLAFFVSDNGFQWVEHGLWGKDMPYDESVRVPFFARWPGHLAEGTLDDRLAALVDIAPTIMDAAGLTPDPAVPMDGASLLQPSPRSHVLTEAWPAHGPPAWASIRGARFSYVEYFSDDEQSVVFREFYDLGQDPWQLENILGDTETAGDPDVAALHDLLVAARSCTGVDCSVGMASTFVEVSDPVVTEDSAGAEAVFSVSLSHPASDAVQIPYSTADGTATGPADYRPVAGTLTIPAGDIARPIKVRLRSDGLDEMDDTFFLDLSSATNAVLIDSRGTATIVDDDPEPALSVADASVTEGDDGSTVATFSTALSSASGKTVVIDFATGNGSAVAPGDYTATSGTLTIPAGQTIGQIAGPVIGDEIHEPDETFFLRITGASGASVVDAEGMGTIADDDPEPSIWIGDVTTPEGATGTNVNVPVTLSRASSQTVTVAFGTANGTAQAGRDYAATFGTLSFAPGQVAKTIRIKILGDALWEPDEFFLVDLSAAQGGAIADAQAQVGIVNDDPAP